MIIFSLTSIKKVEQRRVCSVTYVEKFRRILKDLDVLSKEQRKYRDEILKVLAREDAAVAEATEGEEAV